MLLACLNSSSATLTAITDARAFTVCVLDTDSRAISELFAAPGHEQYAMVDWQRAGHTQMPILKAALAYAECTVHGISEAGDHTVVFGTVVGGSADHTRDPLGYWRTNYLRLPNAIEIYGKADAVWIGEL
jgi:flavin reductase (DIM6/NTAB) family NADH-FMN oxidoreductase RutF